MSDRLQNNVSLPVIKRLPKYYRYLLDMRAGGAVKVSSSELARMMGATASQVRQDLNCFGGFGQQGIGYQVDVLLGELEKLLFQENDLQAILIGTGRLGRAISGYLSSEARGYKLIAAFDKSPAEIGKTLKCGLVVRDITTLADFCRQERPDVVALCVPRDAAQEVAPTLVEAGVKGYWNFSHFDLSVSYENITVENVHLGDSLMSLGYRVRNQ